MLFDQPSAPPVWLPPKPAIIRPASDLNRHDRRAIEREFGIRVPPVKAMLPGMGAPVVRRTAPAITISNTANQVSGTDGSSFTFTSAAIGTAAANRIVVVVATVPNTNTNAFSSITIGGNAATFLFNGTVGGSRMAIAALLVASGTTATIVATFAGSMPRCGLSVYRLDNLQSLTPVDSNSSATGATGFSLRVYEGGAVLLAGARSNAATDRRHVAGSAAITADSGARSIAMAADGTMTGVTSNYDTNTEAASSATFTHIAAVSLR